MAQDELTLQLDQLDQRVLRQLNTVVSLMGEESVTINKQTLDDVLLELDKGFALAINQVLFDPEFRRLEGIWRGIADLVASTDFSKNIALSIWDVKQEELNDDISANVADWTNSELFNVLYSQEYDQHGGAPYGAIIGLYDFTQSDDDLGVLRGLGAVCKKSHVPFVGNASAAALGQTSMDGVVGLRDASGELTRGWQLFRKTEESAYVGLALPRYIARAPYKDYTMRDIGMRFVEDPGWDDETLESLNAEQQRVAQYVWGCASILFAQNLVRSFASSGWCQYIRGVDSGGTISGLPLLARDPITNELEPPLEAVFPDNVEYTLAQAGFIPLVWEKGTTKATFFSAQSMKYVRDGSLALSDQDAHYAENEALTANLAYTYTISRLAHYLKLMMRGNIGTSADATYVKAQIDAWISRYVTTVINPDDLTLRYYPFKAFQSSVNKVPGRPGWFDCSLTVQPHIQFEGIDISLKVDARLTD
jgi:type VI secretion system protein ImpC